MFRRTLLFALGAGIVAVACSESTGPPLESPPPPDAVVADGNLHDLRWSGTGEFSAVVGSPHAGGDLETAVVTPASLDAYEVRFWAVRGNDRFIEIHYTGQLDGMNGSGVHPFLRLDVPSSALYRRPDGSSIAWGDSVLITVTIETSRIGVHLEPSGLKFSPSTPATIRMWYTGAGGDLNGDNVVDEADVHIERTLLRLWYQAAPQGDWQAMQAEHVVASQWFRTRLQHFSGYAVSY